jgi:hypothetical protein
MENKTTDHGPERYWQGHGTHGALAKKLMERVPSEGACSCRTPELEKLRQAVNAYYDLYNNGGINRVHEIRKIFGVGGRTCWSDDAQIADAARWKVEEVMDKRVLAAAKEWLWQEFQSQSGDITNIPKPGNSESGASGR